MSHLAPLRSPPHPWRRWDMAGLVIVFALALALRWGWPGVVDFKLDEASASRLALAFAQDRRVPLYGVTSSTGVPTPPNAIWVLAAPYLLGPDPLLATAWIGLLSALSVAVGYWLAHRYFGSYAALVTGLLHAASPWSVYYARKVWTPSGLPLFAVLTVATGALGFIEGRPRWQAAHVFLLVFTVGVHFSSLPLVLVTLFLMLAGRARINWRMIALGALGVIIITIPFVIGVIYAPDVIMTDRAAIREHQVHVSAEALEFTWLNTVGADLYKPADPDAPFDHPARAEDEVDGLLALEGGLVVAGAAALATYGWQRRRGTTGQFTLMILVWLLSYVAMFTVQWVPVFPHYFMALWPAPYLVIGAGLWLALTWLRERTAGWRLAAFVGLLAVGSIVGAQTHMLNRFYTFAGAHFTPGDFGTPLGLKMQGARAARDLLGEIGAEEVIVVGEGDRPYQYEGPGAFDVMLHDVPHRFVDGARAAVLPDHPAVILLQPREWPAAPWYLASSEERGRISLREAEGDYTLLLYDPVRREGLRADFAPATPPATLANGARILGHRWAREQIELAWRVERGPPPDEYHFVSYFFARDLGVLAQADGPSYPAAYWRPGDTIVNWFPLAPPQAPPLQTQLRVGMYTYPDIVRAIVVDEAGAAVEDSVLLGYWSEQGSSSASPAGRPPTVRGSRSTSGRR